MLLRKRAWDIMREEFLVVEEKTSMAEVITKLRESISKHADDDFAIVIKESGQLAGVITARDMLRAIEDCVLRDDVVRNAEETDWDRAFAKACTLCCHRSVKDIMERRPPTVRPNDPVLLVLNKLVDSKVRWAVVEEGAKPIGVVLINDLFSEISREMVKSF